MDTQMPLCARCGNPLQISAAALRAMEKLAKFDRPATCAKCAVDHASSNNNLRNVQNESH